jgi:hypothetical protein
MHATIAQKWANHAHVRDAIDELGYGDDIPHGHDDVLEFMHKLLEVVDRRSAIVPTELVELVTEWEAAVQAHRFGLSDNAYGGVRSQASQNWLHGMPARIPRCLLSTPVAGRRIDFEHCAWLLKVSERDLERLLWPNSLERLEYAAGAVLGRGAPLNKATCKPYGVAVVTLREYLDLRHGYRVPMGRRPAVGRTHLAEALRLVDEVGMSNRQAFDRLRADGVDLDEGYYDNFVKSIRRHRLGLAAVAS